MEKSYERKLLGLLQVVIGRADAEKERYKDDLDTWDAVHRYALNDIKRYLAQGLAQLDQHDQKGDA